MALSKTFASDAILTAEDVNKHLVHHVPAPGDPFDTGWIDFDLEDGFEIQPGFPLQVRRVGINIYIRGGFSNTGLIDGIQTVAMIPEAFRPSRSEYGKLISNNAATTSGARVFYSGGGGISLRTGASLGSYYIIPPNTGWLTD